MKREGCFRELNSILISFVLIAGFISQISLVGSFSGGDGSLADPYVITNCTQLNETRDDLTANYSLGNNINMSDAGCEDFQSDEGFEPIGNETNPFEGNFNGTGKIISNLFINRPSLDYVGLFGYCEQASIYDVGLENVNITGDDNVGGLVGSLNYSTIDNFYAVGNVNGKDHVGGLVGYVTNNSNIANSNATGNVTATGDGVGGLVGYVYEVYILIILMQLEM